MKEKPARRRFGIAAIVLWNTVYLARAINGLREAGRLIDHALLTHRSPLGWEHINLTGDYVWHANKRVAKGRFRPLRKAQDAISHLFTTQPEAYVLYCPFRALTQGLPADFTLANPGNAVAVRDVSGRVVYLG